MGKQFADKDVWSVIVGAMQVWFMFSGNGGQWPRMALSLLKSQPVFRASIKASAAILADVKVDLLGEFAAEAGFKDPMHSALGLCCVQIALVDLLKEEFGISPDGMLGHSAGENCLLLFGVQISTFGGRCRLATALPSLESQTMMTCKPAVTLTAIIHFHH